MTSAQLLSMLYVDGLDPATIVEAHREWGRRYDPPPPRPKRADVSSRLRLGFVSQDLRGNHPVTFFLRPLLHALNWDHFDVTLYSATLTPDAVTGEFASLGRFRDISKIPDAGAAQVINDDRIDVLIDLCGHLPHSRLTIFTLRPAPIQISWLAYPNTSGLSSIDFRLSDAIADPPSRCPDLEKLDPVVRLNSCFLCYQPPQRCPPVSALPAWFRRYVTFGVFNNPAKITASAINLWAEVLHQVPRSRMLFHHGFGRYDNDGDCDRLRITTAFADRSVDPGRLAFIGPLDFLGGLNLYNEADIALDTFPYNGATTTCESLWMGLPVVHLAGKNHAARVTTTILHHASLQALVAHSPDEYIATAIRLAADIPELARFRFVSRSRLAKSTLLDSAGFARTFGESVRNAVLELSLIQ